MIEISSWACLQLGKQLGAMGISDIIDGVSGLVDKNKMSVSVIALCYFATKLEVLADNDPDVAKLVEACKSQFRVEMEKQFSEHNSKP